MSSFRAFVLVAGPIPILLAGLLAARWAGPRSDQVVASNHVLAAEPAKAAPRRSVEEQPRPPANVDDRCRAAAAALARRLDEHCRLIVRPPFVIAGDLSEAELERWHTDTIRPAAVAMDACYFDTPPDEPITVLLFSGEAPYDRYARWLFGDEGISVYGYYKPAIRTLVMNIGTGGGTLVHELTHALIDFDFPGVPDWFNEGLASLHEQCRFRESAEGPWIEGLPNWRLPALQQAVQQGRLGSLERLATDGDFRGPHEALNYAQARYLCMYLQERGLLAKFYREFRESQKRDRSGVSTLEALFAGKDWREVDAEFRNWVLGIKSHAR